LSHGCIVGAMRGAAASILGGRAGEGCGAAGAHVVTRGLWAGARRDALPHSDGRLGCSVEEAPLVAYSQQQRRATVGGRWADASARQVEKAQLHLQQSRECVIESVTVLCLPVMRRGRFVCDKACHSLLEVCVASAKHVPLQKVVSGMVAHAQSRETSSSGWPWAAGEAACRA
jgi:hypothetical protein